MTRRLFTPRPYQRLIEAHILEHPRCAIWAGMGMGKSSATLTALDTLSIITDVFPALVIAPLRVAQSTWPDEAATWEHLRKLILVPVVGNAHERRAALAREADIYTINYENVPWLVDVLGDEWPFRTIVADESTKLKGFRTRQGTLRARALAQVAHKTEHFIELTGTPSPNGLQDIWGQAWFIDRGARLGRSFSSFAQRWFRPTWDGYGLEALPHAQREIEERMRDVCLSLDARDWFDLDEPIRNVIRVDMPPKAQKLYRQMEREMYVEIERHGIEAFDAASRTIKCLQLASGFAYHDDQHNAVDIHDAKIQALDSVIEEAAGMPVLVAYQFKHDLARLQRAFPRGRVLDKDPATIKAWNAGKIPLLFAHPASAGHGINLQDGGNILVFFGLWWNLEEHLQIIERIGPTRQKQAGHDRPVFLHYIVAKDTVDELVLQRLATKQTVQDLLLQAMKQKEVA